MPGISVQLIQGRYPQLSAALGNDYDVLRDLVALLDEVRQEAIREAEHVAEELI